MSAASFFVFLVLLVAVLGGINAVVFRWARNAFRLGPAAQRGLKLVLLAAIAGMVLGRVAGRFWSGAGLRFVIASGSTLELAVIISGILLLMADGLRLLLSLPGRWRARSPAGVASVAAPASGSSDALAAVAVAPVPELPRRAFLAQATAGSAFLIGSSSALYGALKGRYDYSVEEVVVKIPGLPRALEGFSIAQLSDVHIGVFVGDAELNIAEALLRQAKPDLIVLTGDLLDNDPRLAGQLGRFVRRLPPLAREGVVAISGNHDYFAGVEEMAAAVSGAGGRMLRNDAMIVGGAGAGFALLGVDDVWARREGAGPDLQRSVRSLPRLGGRVAPAIDLPRILLCHNPSFFAEAAGQVALQLSGHTHGGQVNLGVRPADYILPGGWVAGRYDLRGSALYVNRGFGTVGPPARIGAPPEVTRIILTG
jgi:predicted MPP superfamily phosphohydrolase